MIETVYLLWHTHQIGGADHEKLIGVYSAEGLAADAKSRMLQLPGFRECPNGFEIVPAVLNKDSWEEGYVTYKF